jgi:hypothetical protein
MVGMQMSVYRLEESETELLKKLQIAVHFFQDGIDEQGFAAMAAGQQVRVGSRSLIEELAEYHVLFSER